MITPVWIIGFTGHRPKDSPGRTSAEMEHLADAIHVELEKLQTKAVERGGRAEFLCGVAAGADLIAAREAERLGMPVHVILPMPLGEFAKDFVFQPLFAEEWAVALGMPMDVLLTQLAVLLEEELFRPPAFAADWAARLGKTVPAVVTALEGYFLEGKAFAADWAEAQRFIKLAQGVTGGATFRCAHGSQLRNDCYYDLGSQIVYASDAVVALWDGKEAPEVVQIDANTTVIAPGRGGTADVVDLARADRMPYLKGKAPKDGYQWLSTPMRRINSVTGEVDGDVSNFASERDAGLAEMQAIEHAAHADRNQHLLAKARDLVAFVGRWAKDCARRLRRALLGGEIEPAAHAEHGTLHALHKARDLMDFVDHRATDWAKRLRSALLWGLILHFFASLIAAVSASGQETIHDKAAKAKTSVVHSASGQETIHDKAANAKTSVAHSASGQETIHDKAAKAKTSAAVSASGQETIHDKAAKAKTSAVHSAWSMDWHWAPANLAALELVLVGAAVLLMFWAHCKHAQQRWLELRLATELTRALASAGRLLDPLFPIATDHLPGWRRFCLSVGLIIWRDPATAPATTDAAGNALSPAEQFEALKGRYLKLRVLDQRDHFKKHDPARRHKWHGATAYAGPIIAVLAAVFVFIALCHKVDLARDTGHVHEVTVQDAILFYFLPIALPLLAAAISSLQAVTDVKRRAHVYPEMVERLNGAASYLTAIRTHAALGRFVRRTEEIMLDELVGWYAAAKGISH